MSLERTVLALTTGGLLAALAAGCASPAKAVKPSTDVTDGAAQASKAPPPPAPVAAPPPAPPPAQPPCAVTRVQFAFDSAALDGAAREALKADAACLAERRPGALVIEGHCDERGTEAYNLALGQRRAVAVRSYLVELGAKVPMEAISFGESKPLAPGEGEGAWTQNRRAELRLPGERRADGSLVK